MPAGPLGAKKEGGRSMELGEDLRGQDRKWVEMPPGVPTCLSEDSLFVLEEEDLALPAL